MKTAHRQETKPEIRADFRLIQKGLITYDKLSNAKDKLKIYSINTGRGAPAIDYFLATKEEFRNKDFFKNKEYAVLHFNNPLLKLKDGSQARVVLNGDFVDLPGNPYAQFVKEKIRAFENPVPEKGFFLVLPLGGVKTHLLNKHLLSPTSKQLAKEFEKEFLNRQLVSSSDRARRTPEPPKTTARRFS